MWCRCNSSGLCFVPPAPEVMAQLYAEYLQRGKPLGLSFKDFLVVVGFINVAEFRPGMDDGLLRAPADGPQRISVPRHAINGPLHVKVLLIDFSDRAGSQPASHYEQMLFSKGTYPRGSMRDFYHEVTLGKVDVQGTVHGWIRMPRAYSYYTNGSSGTGNTYPRNAQGMAEDAVKAALAAGVTFAPELDALGQGAITALFIVHAGIGAESASDQTTRDNNIWSHKWMMPNSVQVANGLRASVYLTVPNDAKIGVCAHELGHLAFQWEDFYDPNYDEDGSEWDGCGRWDLMAGGSWNGGGSCPAHPAALHKMQHGWIQVQDINANAVVAIDPYTKTAGSVVKITSPQYRQGQYLLVENRVKKGFDSELPGQGLLVWRVDEQQDMFKPDRPALLLLQADGRHDLERSNDWNEGDSGDPFPGTGARVELTDEGDLSTTFPGGNSSGVRLRNIAVDSATGRATFEVQYGSGGTPLTGTRTVERTIVVEQAIPDAKLTGLTSTIALEGPGVVREIAIDVDITHTYISDLRVELIAPSGMTAVLHANTGGSGDNIKTVYRSTELAALAKLVGEPVVGTWKLRVVDSVASDIGILNRWGIAVAVDGDTAHAGGTRTLSPALTIPDNNPAGVADVLTVARAGQAKSLRVDVDITHSYIQDVRLELEAPDGSRALLHNRSGGSADDIKRAYSSSDTPALAALVGREVRGPWTLRVADLASRDTGTLNSWKLDIDLSSAPQSAVQEATPGLAIPDNTPAGVGNALTFNTAGTVQAIELKAAIDHPYIGDLRVELVAPSGRSAIIHDRTGNRTANLALDLTSATNAALATLVGQPSSGQWILRVADLDAADVGTFKFWSLRLTYI